jgi:hypothetical protein
MFRARLLFVASLVVACAPTGATRAPGVVAAEVGTVAAVAVVSPGLVIRFEPVLGEGPVRLSVELTVRGISTRRWAFASAVAVEPGELRARDEAGELAVVQGREGPAWTVELARAPVGTLTFRYWFHPGDVSRGGPELPAGLVLRADHQRVLATAEEVLLLPRDDPGAAIAVELALLPVGTELRRVASTLGAPGWQGTVGLAELRHAAFLIGRLGQAEFRGPEGSDDFAWYGDTAFDLRWSAAETAGARTAVDAYFSATATRRFVGLMAVDVDFVGGTGVSVFARGEGLYVAIAPGARWDARARMAVAHGLVHRWIGGRLRLRSGDEGPEAGAWFSAGFARMVAREVLYDLGTLSGRDYAEEVNVHEAVLATAPLRRASNAEVAAAAAGGDAEAQALLMARGVLYATRLAALLVARSGGRETLRELLGGLVQRAQAAGVGELPLEAFTERVAERLGQAEVGVFVGSVIEGGVLTLPADALGPCFVRTSRVYRRFDLGFAERATLEAEPPTIHGLRAGGPAARAGLKEGERVLALAIDPEDAMGPATVTVLRGEREVQVTYRPASAPERGEGWSRRAGVSERECPL